MTTLTIEGRTLTVEEWADEYGIPASLIRERLRKAWFPDRAVTTPMQPSIADQFMKPKVTTDAPTVQRIVVPSTHKKFTEPAKCNRPAIPFKGSNAYPIERPRRIEFDGKELTIREWAERLRVKPQLIHYRLRKGWPLERVLDGRVGATGFRRHYG